VAEGMGLFGYWMDLENMVPEDPIASILAAAKSRLRRGTKPQFECRHGRVNSGNIRLSLFLFVSGAVILSLTNRAGVADPPTASRINKHAPAMTRRCSVPTFFVPEPAP
jgi:hypothetical protein